MVQPSIFSRPFSRVTEKPLYQTESPKQQLAIHVIEIDWNYLTLKRADVLATNAKIPPYLLMPEINRMLSEEKHFDRRLAMDLMWGTGATVSELLDLTPEHFVFLQNKGYFVELRRRRSVGRPTKVERSVLLERSIPLRDAVLIDSVQSYIVSRGIKPHEPLFPTCRQTINRHIKQLADRMGGFPFSVHAEIFRHSFAVHLFLHAYKPKTVSDLLGCRNAKYLQIFNDVLAMDADNLLKGVAFH